MRREQHNPSVRQAEIADASALAEIKRTIEDRTYASFGTAEEHRLGLEAFCSTAYVEGMIGDPRTTVLVAEHHGNPIGLAALSKGDECDQLHAVYALEAGRGVGLMLVATAARVALRRGQGAMCCEIFENNTNAVRFFTRLGFRSDGERPSDTYRSQRLLRFRAVTSLVTRNADLARSRPAAAPLASTKRA